MIVPYNSIYKLLGLEVDADADGNLMLCCRPESSYRVL